MTEIPIIYKPLHGFAMQINVLILYDMGLHHERVEVDHCKKRSEESNIQQEINFIRFTQACLIRHTL